MVNRTLILSTLFICLFSASTGYTGDLRASASRNQIGINESVTLQLTAIGDSDDEPDLSVLEQDFEIAGRSQSSQVTIINGDVSRSKVWTLTLLPRRSGSLTIPAICSGADCSQPSTIKVRKQPPGDQNNARVLLEVEISAHEVMAQAQLIYTVRLLMRQPLAQASLSELKPQGVETSVHQLGDDVRYETQRGSWRYQVVERNYALFPQHSGILQLPPLRLEGLLQGENRSRFNARFDPFGQQGQLIRLRSQPIEISVIAPPPSDTQQPWLPATKFNIEDEWQHTPPTLNVGEPATRSITTTATGLAAAQLPELKLSAPQSFKSYPDQTVRKDIHKRDGIRGSMVQKVALVPTQAGTFTLPAVQLKWWDIDHKKWRTQSTEVITLNVLPARRDVGSIPIPPPQSTTPTVAPVDTSPAPPTTTIEPTAGSKSIWQWLSLLCATGWIITLIIWQRQKRDARRTRQEITPNTVPAAQQNAGTALKEAIRLAKNNEAQPSRAALMRWIHALNHEHKGLTADTFLRDAPEPLKGEIIALNQYLYALNDGDNEKDMKQWDGQPLSEALQCWKPSPNNTKESVLPAFYPPDD
ncbi:MAG: BatD family protein [Thermodesulfobacteriota bacterium]|nr:BatD family protein [Thermodesulfobacteriota bacterium]